MIFLVGNKICLISQERKITMSLFLFLSIAITIIAESHYHSGMALLIIYIIG